MCIFPVCMYVLPAALLLAIIGRYSAASTLQNRELSSLLCDDLEWWDGGMGGRSKREGVYVYVQLIHFTVPQKLT